MSHVPSFADAEKPARLPIPKKLRFAVFQRDEFRCVYCGARAEDTVLHADHRVPVARGGESTFHNLVTSCVACNLGKGASSLKSELRCQREAAICCEVFEYAWIHLRVPISEQGGLWWEIYNFSHCDGAEALIDLVRSAESWVDFRLQMQAMFCSGDDPTPPTAPANDNTLIVI
jgi:hypothetical protein